MTDLAATLVVCPRCNAPNRVPNERIHAADRRGVCGKCKAALFPGEPVELGAGSFDAHVEHSELPMVVDFWAPWCGPCRAMAPAFAEAARQFEPSVRCAKLNTEEQQAIAARYGIRSIPTLIVFKNGREIARQSGAMDATSLMRWIRSVA